MERIKVFCRKARQEDTDDVMELTSTIWDGEDYIPKTWADWLADVAGLLAVAEYQGRVLGLGKLSRLSQRDWWLEGLRVHPEYQERGIASQLNQYLIAHWLEHGKGAVRLATSAKRAKIHHMCRRHEMVKILELTWFVTHTQAQPMSPDPFQAVSPSEIHQAVTFAQNSQSLELSAGLMNLIWRYAPPAKVYLSEDIEHGRAFWWRQRAGLLTFATEPDERGVCTARIKLLAGRRADLPVILGDFRHLAGAQNFPQVGWMAPLRDDVLKILEDAGYNRDWDSSLYIYARHHPNR